MNSEVDISILNSVNIKRFTKSVLEEYGAEIDRSNRAKWDVTFPDELVQQLDRDQGTLVFDAADRERGAGELLVQPGTTAFSALLNLVQQSGSIGSLELTEDSLQVNPPTVLRESDLRITDTEFSEQTTDFALTFHFRVQFETPASFHNEEMFSVTIDPETQTRLPELTARLTSHLPQLLQQNNEQPSQGVPKPHVQEAFEEAQQAVIDRSRPIVADLREEADDSASERIDEISDWYAQRRDELEQQLEEQRSEIGKWRKKRRNARKDSTRRKYIKNRNEAEQELERLQDEVAKKKQELDAEESAEIEEVLDRNAIDVEVSLLGVTEVTYARGTLELSVSSGYADTDVALSYLPATDDFRGLDCNVCSRDLTEGILPQLCVNGHLIGDPCSTSCRSCGIAYCDTCGEAHRFTRCEICWEEVCPRCEYTCSECTAVICADHNEACTLCESVTCHLCGEDCSTCGSFHCDFHLAQCAECTDYHCDADRRACESCGAQRCTEDIGSCSVCSDWLCSDHSMSCTTCGETLCETHIQVCALCSAEEAEDPGAFCRSHATPCSVGEKVVCSNHRVSRTLGSGYVCHDHRDVCNSCQIGYSEPELTDGQCSACRSLGEVDPEHIPAEIASEFRSVEAGGNNAYLVILGKKLLGRNKLIVYDVQSEEEVDRHSAGMLKQLMGGYE